MILYVFFAFFLVCSQVAGEVPEYKLSGQKAIIKTGIKSPPDDISWKFNGNKVVEFDGNEEKSYPEFTGRVSLDYHSADSTISNLRFEDSGSYESETYTNKQSNQIKYKLEVIDKVAKPTISCKMSNADTSDKSRAQANSTCSTSSSSSSSSLVKFKWNPNANVHHGPQLVITLGDENDDLEYECTVSNPLTNDSATFIAKDCYSDTNIPVGSIAGVVVGISLSIIILILCILYRKGCLSHEKESDVESQELPSETKINLSENEERQVLSDRAPTLPSKQTLGHLAQGNDAALSDPPHKEESAISRKKYHRNSEEAYMNELRESIRRRPSEKNEFQDSESSSNSPAPDKPPRTFSDRHAKENGKANEAEASYVAEDAERNAEQTHVSPEHNDEERPKVDELGKDTTEEKKNPADSENEENSLSGSEEDVHEDNKDLHPPGVPKKTELVRKYSDLIKAGGESTPSKVKRPVGEDPADSGNPNEEADDQSLNTTAEDTMVSSPPPVSPKTWVQKEPADSKETDDALPGFSIENSSEEDEHENNKTPHRPVVPKKTELVRKYSDLIKAGGESTPPKVIKRPVGDDPAESGNPNEKADGQSLNTTAEDTMVSSPPPVSPESLDQKESANSKKTNYDFSGSSDDNKDDVHEDNKDLPPPEVPKKSEIVRNYSDLIKAGGDRMRPKVIKRPVGDDPAESGNPDEEEDDQNSEMKEEEKESTKPSPENDVQPPSVAKENSPSSQNSPKISPKDEQQEDPSSDESAVESGKESMRKPSAGSSDESENESPGASSDSSKGTDSESSENEQQPPSHETESQGEARQK